MLNALLVPAPHSDGNFYFNNFGEALIYALIGFLVVFAGIVLIIFIIWLLGLILRKTNNLAFLSKFKIHKGEKQGPLKEQAQTTEESEDDIPAEVKVAIIAAIMAYYGENKPECDFKVKRIKRI